jgi:outer membrane scaffolding protein for murein synthesis (MipA/OmpV family)
MVAADDAPAPPAETFWEVGIGPGVARIPNYVGSDHTRTWTIPIPYIVVDSPHITIDRGVLSGILPLTGRLRLDLSLSGAPPVRGGDDHAREGMSELDGVVEIGPSLDFDLYRRTGAGWPTPDSDRVSLELPVRSAFAIDFDHFERIGWIVNPLIEYQMKRPLALGRLTFTLNTGPLFQSQQYNAYFYEVRDRDARPGRPAYDADAGYAGWRIAGGAGVRWRDFWFGAFARYINIRGADFDGSPLVKSDHYLAVGCGVAWVFAGTHLGGGD